MNKDMEEQEVEDNKTLEQNNIQKTVNIDDFQNICRGCMSRNDLNEIETVQYSDGTKLKDLYKTYFSIDINLSTILPQNICMDCTYNIFNFYSLTQQVIKSENIFKNIFEQQFVKYEESEYANDNKFEILMEEAEENVESDEEPPLLTPNDESPEDNISKKKLEEPEEVVVEEPEEETTPKEIIKPNDAQKNVTKQGKKHRLKECEICHKNVDSSKRSQHMRIHTGEKPFSCSICHQSFNIMGNLRRHQMIHTGEKPHVCNICGRGFIQAVTLQIHLARHKPNEIISEIGTHFQCKFCPIIFKRYRSFKEHERQHKEISNIPLDEDDVLVEEKPFVCNACGKSYKTKVILTAHMMTHGEKSYLCTECGKGFYTKAELNSHLKVHTKLKPHKCEICGKSFAWSGTYSSHMLTHTGHKPYACIICGRRFVQTSHLKCHLRTHTGERPYECPFCGLGFALKGNMIAHSRKHTGETPFVCSVCNKGFSTRSSLKKHVQTHVKNETKNLGVGTEESKDLGVDDVECMDMVQINN